ncbi:MAG TPA: GNAT family N-acetyltransferase [Anaerolineaceae bacterium]|nr:GNAT family N-acetyltransferase [Anaerolineaceae bacterium]
MDEANSLPKLQGRDHQLVFLDAEGVSERQSQIVAVYRNAFEPEPYREDEADVQAFAEWLGRHSRRPGFRMLAAIEPSHGQISGFAYGYTSTAGQWWYDVVARALSPEARAEWMKDAFELVELAVDPPWQGKKLGSLLHDRLLASASHQTGLLSTLWTDTTALRLYQKRGWQTLLEDFYFPGVAEPYRVMGLRLNGANPAR